MAKGKPSRLSQERTAFAIPDASGQTTEQQTVSGKVARNKRVSSSNQKTIHPNTVAAESKVDLGRTLADRYRVVEFLGEGGMGEVYRARDLTLDMDVAVKLLNEDLAGDEQRVAYFRNEVKLARRVTHPNICRLHDIVQEDGMWFITMQYVVGESLAARLKRERTLALHEVIDLLQQLCRGLAAAHAVGVIHRDLKPGNVLLEASTGRAIVADFGIATEISVLGQGPVDIAGTRGYMAPEHAAGLAIDARTDLYALGVLGHRMITGVLPPQIPTVVANTDFGAASIGLPDNVDPMLAEFISRCLANSPDDRPTSALDALALIDDRPEEVFVSAPKRARWPFVAVALLAIGGGIVAMVWSQAESKQAPSIVSNRGVRVAITSIDATGLSEEESWFGSALQRRIASELSDAWDLDVDVSADASSRPDVVALSGVLQRSANGHLEIRLSLPPGADSEPKIVRGESLQELAEAAAAAIVAAIVPTDKQEPTAQTLIDDGASSVDAWRLWRRAQRASLMQQWSRARKLATQASQLDPEFAPAYFEEGWSHGRQDQVNMKPLLQAMQLVDDNSEIGKVWRVITRYQRAAFAGNEVLVKEILAETLGLPLSPRIAYYIEARTIMADYFNGRPEETAPKLEFLAERYPLEPGLPKLLANYYLKLESEDSGQIALGHAERAFALAPDDIGVRADYGRALLRVGKRAEATQQSVLIAAADPEEKMRALAGGERSNSLFDLHMSLGQIADASRDARRMLVGSEIDRGHAEVMLSEIDAYRGNLTSAHARRKEALRIFRKVKITEFIASDRFTRAQSLFDQGMYGETLAVLRESSDVGHGWSSKILHLRTKAQGTSGKERSALFLEAEGVLKEAGFESSIHTLRAMQLASDKANHDRVLLLAQKLRASNGRIAWLFHAGEAHEQLGNNSEAEHLFRLLATHYNAWTEPHLSALAWLRAGKLREKSGDGVGAQADYKRFLDRYEQAPPTDPNIRWTRARLRRLARKASH